MLIFMATIKRFYNAEMYHTIFTQSQCLKKCSFHIPISLVESDAQIYKSFLFYSASC